MKQTTKQNIKENTYLLLIIAVVVLLIGMINNHKVLDEKNAEIEYLNKQIKTLEIAKVEDSEENEEKVSTSISTEETYIRLKTVELSDGSYSVPEDIAAGTYNVSAKEGYGLLTGDFASGYISTTIGYSSHHGQTRTYSNLKLSNGDKFTIESGCTMVFEPK